MGASFVVRPLKVVTIFCVVAAGLIGASAARASAAQCESWGGQPPDRGSSTNQLQGVAATSACNAWAVGSYNNGTADQTLIEHWGGKAWKVQTSPNQGGSSVPNDLTGVAAASRTDAWAVGSYDNGMVEQTLIEHWNGRAWKVSPSPNPGGSTNANHLSGVAVTSRTNAWAVGSYFLGKRFHTLIEHWNGTKWSQQTSPTPGPSCAGKPQETTRAELMVAPTVGLSGVVATSSSNAWAVGSRCKDNAFETLIEHWNGNAWKVQPSKNPGGSGKMNRLFAVAATSSANAWAVGSNIKGARMLPRTLVEHWNGKAWKVQPSPNTAPSTNENQLFGVAATSTTNAWAVGNSNGLARNSNGFADPPVVERWNGKAWKVQPSSNFTNGFLFGVAAISSSDAWAVGSYFNGMTDQSLILHCC